MRYMKLCKLGIYKMSQKRCTNSYNDEKKQKLKSTHQLTKQKSKFGLRFIKEWGNFLRHPVFIYLSIFNTLWDTWCGGNELSFRWQCSNRFKSHLGHGILLCLAYVNPAFIEYQLLPFLRQNALRQSNSVNFELISVLLSFSSS